MSAFTEAKYKIIDQHNTLVCIPTFEEFCEMLYLRDTGKFNMYTDDILRGAYDHGLYAFVDWLLRCKECKQSWMKCADLVKQQYIDEHGPIDGWLTSPEIKTRLDQQVLLAEELRLEQELRQKQERLEELKRLRNKR